RSAREPARARPGGQRRGPAHPSPEGPGPRRARRGRPRREGEGRWRPGLRRGGALPRGPVLRDADAAPPQDALNAVAIVLALLLQAAAPVPAPLVREIAVEGAAVYQREDVVRIVRQAEGQPLRAPAETLAARLESRYHLDGYLAAAVTGTFV